MAAAREVYRTLKPGGVAVATVWTDMSHADALHHAHYRTRGRVGPMPTLLPDESYTESDLRQALEAGGFQSQKILSHEKVALCRIPDVQRWAQLAWSYLGHTPEGWNQRDEEKWEEAVQDVAEQMSAGRGLQQNEKGETIMRMVACVAVATKERAQLRLIVVLAPVWHHLVMCHCRRGSIIRLHFSGTRHTINRLSSCRLSQYLCKGVVG